MEHEQLPHGWRVCWPSLRILLRSVYYVCPLHWVSNDDEGGSVRRKPGALHTDTERCLCALVSETKEHWRSGNEIGFKNDFPSERWNMKNRCEIMSQQGCEINFLQGTQRFFFQRSPLLAILPTTWLIYSLRIIKIKQPWKGWFVSMGDVNSRPVAICNILTQNRKTSAIIFGGAMFLLHFSRSRCPLICFHCRRYPTRAWYPYFLWYLQKIRIKSR